MVGNANAQTEESLCARKKVHFSMQKTQNNLMGLALRISWYSALLKRSLKSQGNFYACQECQIMLH